jgi:type I restriction enzyme R subunit
MFTDINSEDRLVQHTFAEYLRDRLHWDSAYAWNEETFEPNSPLGRRSAREVVLTRDLRTALHRLNPTLPPRAVEDAIHTLTRDDFSRSTLQHNQAFHRLIRDGVPVSYRDDRGHIRHANAHVLDFRTAAHNRFLVVREPKIQGLRSPHYNRRADLVCFVNGLPLVFVELKAVDVNLRAAYDGNLRDDFETIPQAFSHHAFPMVSNGHHARYGAITSGWEHCCDWKRHDERDPDSLDARVVLDGMLAPERLLDLVENFLLFDASTPGGTRKVVARTQQVLGVNNAVASVIRQEQLKKTFPPEERLRYDTLPRGEAPVAAEDEDAYRRSHASLAAPQQPADTLPLVQRAHPALGRLGGFWHT